MVAGNGGWLRRQWTRLMSVSLGQLLRGLVRVGLAVAVVALLAFAWFVLWPTHNIPALEPVSEYVYLEQGWGEGQLAAGRERYYYTGQGASLPQGASAGAVRYDWFVHLELPFSEQRFADPAHMRKYRFIVDPAPSPANPDQLPVGFTKHFDPGIGEYVLDITCAACHTGEIHYTRDNKTYAVRIDGGQAMHAFTDMSRGSFAPTLLASLINTAVTPWKFDRFAKNVLGDGYPASKPKLKAALWASIQEMLGLPVVRTIRCANSIRSTKALAAPMRSAGSAIPRLAIIWSPRIIKSVMPQSATRICGLSGSSIGCNTTARLRSRWRATSAKHSALVPSIRCAAT